MAKQNPTQQVGMRLPKDIVRAIDKAAHREKRTRTAHILEVLKEYVRQEQTAQG